MLFSENMDIRLNRYSLEDKVTDLNKIDPNEWEPQQIDLIIHTIAMGLFAITSFSSEAREIIAVHARGNNTFLDTVILDLDLISPDLWLPQEIDTVIYAIEHNLYDPKDFSSEVHEMIAASQRPQ